MTALRQSLRSSALFQVYKVEMLIGRLEIFRGNDCGVHFAKNFPDRLKFCSNFFLDLIPFYFS